MKYRAVETFWEAYAQLTPSIKARARKAFRLFQQGAQDPPFHSSLRIRKMQGHPDIWEGHITRHMSLHSASNWMTIQAKRFLSFATLAHMKSIASHEHHVI
jgi:hypothetical protein